MANDMLKEFTKSKDARNTELYGSQNAIAKSTNAKPTPATPMTESPSASSTAETEPTPFVQSSMHGRPVSSAKTARISLAIEPELKERFRVFCASHHITPSDVVDMLLKDYLSQQGVHSSK